ncbi:MAG: hypothetical protein DRO14_06145, partial [Thermoprotei archaeon]
MGLPHRSEYFEKLYSVFRWAEDIRSERGRKRFEESLRKFEELVKHPWVKEVVKEKEELVILDVCGGTGIGGVALAKVLQETGVDVELIINDVRESALEKAKVFAKELLSKEARTIKDDALNIHKYSVKADVALLYGFSTPHFNPYDMVRLAASVGAVLRYDGLYIVEEVDRIYNIMCLIGYKYVLPEIASEEEVVISMHAGYDVRKGVFKRLMLDLTTMRRSLSEAYFWSVAGTAAILWVFFKDVDYLPIDRGTRGFLIAKTPRGVDPSTYEESPAI